MGVVLHHPPLSPEECPQTSARCTKEHHFPADTPSEDVLSAGVYAAGPQSMKGRALCRAAKNGPKRLSRKVGLTQCHFNPFFKKMNLRENFFLQLRSTTFRIRGVRVTQQSPRWAINVLKARSLTAGGGRRCFG